MKLKIRVKTPNQTTPWRSVQAMFEVNIESKDAGTP